MLERNNSNTLYEVLKWAAIIAMLRVAVIHFVEIPDHYEKAHYIGILFVLDVIGSLIAAAGIFLNQFTWGWCFGLFLAAGSFIAFIVSRTIGLPQYHSDDWGPTDVASLIVEGAFVIFFLVRAFESSANTSPTTE